MTNPHESPTSSPRSSRPKQRLKVPAYRQRAGYDQAIVTLTDAATGKRRDYWLGTFGTPESRELYHRLLADWETNGRRLPDRPIEALPLGPKRAGVTVADVIAQYWRWAKSYYTPTSASGIKSALRVLRQCYGSADAGGFGPNALRTVRDAMVLGRDASGDKRPRDPWCRKTVNTRVGHIVRMFRWAASRELVPADVYRALETLPPLKKGRCAAPDHDPVKPVAVETVEETKKYVSRQVAALIDLQLLTGSRPGELLRLRACDIDTTEYPGVWLYRPGKHKTAHRGKERSIFFGPQAQRILAEFMRDRPIDTYLFSPEEAELERKAARSAARKTPLSCGNKPGDVGTDQPMWRAGDCYDTNAYRRAIVRACDKAFPPPPHLRAQKVGNGYVESDIQLKARLTPNQRAELEAWRDEHRWHPHQLRHTAATLLRREFGLEATQLVLGHSSAVVTDAVYAERDAGKVVDVIRRVG